MRIRQLQLYGIFQKWYFSDVTVHIYEATVEQCCGSEMIFSDPEPTLSLISDPDPDWDLDLTCFQKAFKRQTSPPEKWF